MTTIDNIMELADDYADWMQDKGQYHPATTEARQALRTAIEQALTPGEPVGEVSTMPGTSGFTLACFKAQDVPVGTKIYTAPPAAPQPMCQGHGQRDDTALLRQALEMTNDMLNAPWDESLKLRMVEFMQTLKERLK